MEILQSFAQQNHPITAPQILRLEKFASLFREWNHKINLVSRKDIEFFEEHHLLHSLLIAQCVRFPDRARILDLGTGGGLPGLPLAILFPAAQFYLVDSIGKKIQAVSEMIHQLGLDNAHAINKRAEKLESKFDYVLGRAVATLPEFTSWVRSCLRTRLSFLTQQAGQSGLQEPDAFPPPGILYLKGSLYADEVESMGVTPWKVFDLSTLTQREYFQEKFLVYLRSEDLLPYFKKLDEQERDLHGSTRSYLRGGR